MGKEESEIGLLCKHCFFALRSIVVACKYVVLSLRSNCYSRSASVLTAVLTISHLQGFSCSTQQCIIQKSSTNVSKKNVYNTVPDIIYHTTTVEAKIIFV